VESLEGSNDLTIWLQMLLALHRDWAPPEAYEVLLNIARDHASACGLEIQYARTDLDERESNRINGKTEERWWKRWSTVSVQPLRKSQKRP
jgi:hypothetical protein